MINLLAKLRLVDNWQDVLRFSWSVRLILIAAVFSGAEAILPLFVYDLPWPRGTIAATVFLITMAALVARLIAQRNISGGRS